MRRLYEIPAAYRDQDAKLSRGDTTIGRMLAELPVIDADAHCLHLAKLAKEHKAEAETCRRAIKDLQAEATAHADMASVYESEISAYMRESGIDKIPDAVVPISLVSNPPSVRIVSAEDIPTQLTTAVPESRAPDKAAIKRLLVSGESVPGAELISEQRLRY